MSKQSFIYRSSIRALAATFLGLACSGSQAQKNTLELESTFKGNQEQPKVLYIVPWQSIEAPPASYQPMQALIDENFQLVDRDEFRRSVHYREFRRQTALAEQNTSK